MLASNRLTSSYKKKFAQYWVKYAQHFNEQDFNQRFENVALWLELYYLHSIWKSMDNYQKSSTDKTLFNFSLHRCDVYKTLCSMHCRYKSFC